MPLHKLTLLVSLLAASLMLSVVAHGETWSCSYFDKVKGNPTPVSFIRNGGNFDVPVFKAAFRIIYESATVIHLHKPPSTNKAPLYSVALFKDTKRFAMAHTKDTNLEPEVRSWVGGCIID